VIRTFRHKGLKRLFEAGSASGVAAEHVDKISRILARLNVAGHPLHMNAPGFKLHPLKGDKKGFWSVSVSGNWRIIFRFAGEDACDVNLVDYH
jgi:toxin HigB-1